MRPPTSAVPRSTRCSRLARRRAADTSSLGRICGAAPCRRLLTRFETRFGVPIVEGYGLSEDTCSTAVNPQTAAQARHGRFRCRGRRSDCRRRTRGRSDGRGRRGRGPGPERDARLLNRPEETAKTIVDGWLHTGDIGVDADGYLVLVDRIKDMIIRGGENIYPKEIETVVYQLPEVAGGGRRRPRRTRCSAKPVACLAELRRHENHGRSRTAGLAGGSSAPSRSLSTTCPRTRSGRSTNPRCVVAEANRPTRRQRQPSLKSERSR